MVASRRRVQVRVRVIGDVQPTGMRSMMQREAQKYGVTGWVRNSVEDEQALEAIFNGTEGAVLALLRWCERGPMAPRVREVVSEPMPREAFSGFDVRR